SLLPHRGGRNRDLAATGVVVFCLLLFWVREPANPNAFPRPLASRSRLPSAFSCSSTMLPKPAKADLGCVPSATQRDCLLTLPSQATVAPACPSIISTEDWSAMIPAEMKRTRIAASLCSKAGHRGRKHEPRHRPRRGHRRIRQIGRAAHCRL